MTTILAVDSKALFRDMVRSALLTRVNAVHEAASIETALEILSRKGADIHCVVCDWDMVPTGGLELLRMIRCRTIAGLSPRTPVVILTARANADAVKTAMELDVNGFMVTPLSSEKIISAVSHALSHSWILQDPGHYAAVPGVVPPLKPLVIKPLEMKLLEPEPADKTALRPPASRTAAPAAPFPAKAYGRRDPAKAEPRPLRNVRMCVLDDVSPGAVLARDLRDREGRILAPSGTELKPAILERLKNVGYALSDSYCVWVGER